MLSERPDASRAAIAPALAAKIYGLDILMRDIEDEAHNTTRFVVMSADREVQPPPPGARCVTSFLFRVRNLPSALYKAMGGFATNGVNMTKLESYMENGAFTATLFFAEVDGRPEDDNVARAFDELRFFSDYVRDRRRLRGRSVPRRFAGADRRLKLALLRPGPDQLAGDGHHARSLGVGKLAAEHGLDLVAGEPADLLQFDLVGDGRRRSPPRRSGRSSGWTDRATAGSSGSGRGVVRSRASSCSSRAQASSMDSPGSRKPARAEYIALGQIFWRPSRHFSPLTGSMITTGSVRGKCWVLQAGQTRFQPPSVASLGWPQLAQ